jgi:hypothetical protein
MFCENCGTKLEEGIKFCGKCGSKISDATDSKEASQAKPAMEKSTGSSPQLGAKKIASIAIGIVAFFVAYFLVRAVFSPATNSSVGDDAFMSSFKSSFMQSCEAKAGEAASAYCTCAENYLIANNTESQLEALITQVESGASSMPQAMTNAINACAYAAPRQ